MRQYLSNASESKPDAHDIAAVHGYKSLRFTLSTVQGIGSATTINESQTQAWRLSSTSWISSRSLSAGAGLIGSISSEYLLQRTSEDLVACGVDERIQARVDETDCREYAEMMDVHYYDLLHVQILISSQNYLI